jgi:hypothetical protein
MVPFLPDHGGGPVSPRIRAFAATSIAAAVAALVGTQISPALRADAAEAGITYAWGSIGEVFDWERGESTAGWGEFADGTGRIGIYYGQLGLDSGPARYNDTATGDLVSWLGNSGHADGRWELKVKARQWATATPYKLRLELVPAGTQPGACGATTVTLASWSGIGSTVNYGIRSGASRWIRSISLNTDNVFHTFAFERKSTAMTWFVDGKAVARLTSAAAPQAFTSTALVPRLVLDGKPEAEMTHTRMTMDWVRWFSLARAGKTAPSTTPAPTKGAAISGVC